LPEVLLFSFFCLKVLSSILYRSHHPCRGDSSAFFLLCFPFSPPPRLPPRHSRCCILFSCAVFFAAPDRGPFSFFLWIFHQIGLRPGWTWPIVPIVYFTHFPLSCSPNLPFPWSPLFPPTEAHVPLFFPPCCHLTNFIAPLLLCARSPPLFAPFLCPVPSGLLVPTLLIGAFDRSASSRFLFPSLFSYRSLPLTSPFAPPPGVTAIIAVKWGPKVFPSALYLLFA